MKRIGRNPEVFDVLELFSSVANAQGYQLSKDEHVDSFIERVRASLQTTLKKATMIHGKRVESMFLHVAGALNFCEIVKKEDAGVALVLSDSYQLPDYRIITKKGELIFVEVKNFHMKHLSSPFKINKKSLDKLSAYAAVNRGALKIAVYFSKLNQWAMLSPDAFTISGSNALIEIGEALAMSEMATIGDRKIGTSPPLTLEFVNGYNDDRGAIDTEGNANFIIREVQMKCAGQRIEDAAEKEIAFYLLRHGNWDVENLPATIIDGRLLKFGFIANPKERINSGFEIIGDLSAMVSSAFRDMTLSNASQIDAIDVHQDPSYFRLDLPENYQGKHLPIWQMKMQPNSLLAGRSQIVEW